MTLKEIHKIIDESVLVYDEENKNGYSYFSQLIGLEEKSFQKGHIEDFIERGDVLYYYSRNEETGEMKLLAKVDHIDKEKKIIKKKLDKMTQEEIKQLRDKLCVINNACDGCPLTTNRAYGCAADFSYWKDNYFKFKDKEFEVEVEE